MGKAVWIVVIWIVAIWMSTEHRLQVATHIANCNAK